MDDDIARAARAKKGSPFLSTEQAGFYLGLSARKMEALRVSRPAKEAGARPGGSFGGCDMRDGNPSVCSRKHLRRGRAGG